MNERRKRRLHFSPRAIAAAVKMGMTFAWQSMKKSDVQIPWRYQERRQTVLSSWVQLFFWLSVVLLGVVCDSFRMAEDIETLKEFGPKTGEPFTARDGRELLVRIRELERQAILAEEHRRRSDAEYKRLENAESKVWNHEKRLERVEEQCKEMRNK